MRPVALLPLALCPLLFGPAPAHAAPAELPAAFQVRGVGASDVLNIRAEPSSKADAIGQIGPFGTDIEVLELTADGKWGRIGMPEGNGWVAMSYLASVPPAEPGMVPRPLTCSGTEPFWSVSLYPRGAEYNSPDTGVVPMAVEDEAAAPGGFLLRLQEDPTLTRTLIVTREICSDGMSDRSFGFAARLFLQSGEGNAAWRGCCTLDHRER